jgi:hypothetical protein
MLDIANRIDDQGFEGERRFVVVGYAEVRGPGIYMLPSRRL